VAVVVWLILAFRLTIADVWDETNGMLFFGAGGMSLGEKIWFALTQPLGFWRPLPTLLAAVVLHAVPDVDYSWRIMRGLNAAMLLGTLATFVALLRGGFPTDDGTSDSGPGELAFTVAFLFSGSAFITVGWYANVFDAAALLFVAIGLLLLFRGRDLAAGVVIGVAFFCKETAILALPFLLLLFAAGRITLRQALRAAIPATLAGAVYFAVRATIVPFGSEADVHGFAAHELWPTIVNFGESFWRQTMKGSGPGVAGFLLLIFGLASLRRPRLIVATLPFFAAACLIYWGMFSEWQNGVLIHHLNFVGRLYLVPVALMLLILAMERRTIAIAVLCIPILYGAFTTWRDHLRFQETYVRVYRLASTSAEPITVHYPPKPLHDEVRGVRIGDHPGADFYIDAKTGEVLPFARSSARADRAR
jgi:hypothetical protein